jgi:hypothetical protein
VQVPQCIVSFAVNVTLVPELEHVPEPVHDINVSTQFLPLQDAPTLLQYIDVVHAENSPAPVQTFPATIFPVCLPQAPAPLQFGPGPDLVHELSHVSHDALHSLKLSFPLPMS